MTKKIKKAVLPVAGLGTRFLPATKVMPKEMLTVVDKPLIQYAVEEARAAGIEHIVFVTSRGKGILEDHFDAAPELEQALKDKGKFDLLEVIEPCAPKNGAISATRQSDPRGLGHAVWCAKDIIGNEPFAVLLPDDLILSKTPVLKQMVQQYQEIGRGHVVASEDVPREHTSRYGILDVESDNGTLAKAKGLVEKPNPEDAPSTLSIIGRYILEPEIFEKLDKQERGAGNEVQLTDAMAATLGDVPFYGYRFEGRRFDCGNKVGYLAANVAFGLARDDIKDELAEVLKTL